MRKIFITIILIIYISSQLTGCYDYREIDSLAYVMAVGLDKGKTNELRMTLQIAKPEPSGGGSSGGSSSGDGDKSYIILTVEAPTIYSGINMANTNLSKQINLMHTKTVVFSEELAKQNIEPYLHAIERGREFRPSMYLVIARKSAEEYIKNVKPDLVINPSKYYEQIFSNYRYTGFSANTKLFNFYNYSESKYRQPVAILADVSKFNSPGDFDLSNSTYKEKNRSYPLEGDFKAGDITISRMNKSENIGLAVFKGDKMVGEIDGEDASYYLLATNEFDHANWTIPDPRVKNKFVVIDLKQRRSAKNMVDITGNAPHISSKIDLEGDIISIQSGENYENVDNTKILEKAIDDFIKKGMLRFLNKTSKEFNSDICGFGAFAKRDFLTWNEWLKYNWESKYAKSIFTVNVETKLRRTGLMIETIKPTSVE